MKKRLAFTVALLGAFVLGLLCVRPIAKAVEALSVVRCSSKGGCIIGINSATGYGLQASSLGDGVFGVTSYPSTTKGAAAGVAGFDGSTSGSNDQGVSGVSSRGYGVLGLSTAGVGAYGGSSGSTGGVWGATFYPSKGKSYGAAGVLGEDYSTDGGTYDVGVAGQSGPGIGVFGRSTSSTGVVGESTSGTAVSGTSTSSFGVAGSGVTGVFATGVYNGVASQVGTNPGATALLLSANNGAVGPADLIETTSTDAFRVASSGDIYTIGKIYTAGSCSSGCTKRRRIQSYGTSDAQPTLEDEGEGKLVGGVAYVRLDSALASAIDAQHGYVVFITPEADTRGVYVTQRSMAGFVVRENMNGRSNAPFAYRIVARPFGAHEPRLPAVELKVRPALPGPQIRARFTQPTRPPRTQSAVTYPGTPP